MKSGYLLINLAIYDKLVVETGRVQFSDNALQNDYSFWALLCIIDFWMRNILCLAAGSDLYRQFYLPYHLVWFMLSAPKVCCRNKWLWAGKAPTRQWNIPVLQHWNPLINDLEMVVQWMGLIMSVVSSGASIPPKGNDAFLPIGNFPLVSKYFRVCQHLPIFHKKISILSAKISDDLFSFSR